MPTLSRYIIHIGLSCFLLACSKKDKSDPSTEIDDLVSGEDPVSATETIESNGGGTSVQQSIALPLPALLQPNQIKYSSSESIMSLKVSCITGANVVVTGDIAAAVKCIDQEATFSFSSATDGNFHYSIVQSTTDSDVSLPLLFTWTRDTAAPILGGLESFVSNTPKNVEVTVDDFSPVRFSWEKLSGVGDVAFSSPNSPKTEISATADGTYVVRANATDAAGNMTSQLLSFTRDSTMPSMDIGGDYSGPLSTSSRFCNCSDLTALNFIWSQVSGPAIASLTNTDKAEVNISVSIEGIYVFQLVATDLAGNIAQASFSYTYDSNSVQIDAGSDIVSSTSANLNATSNKSNGVVFVWTLDSGPGTVSFGNPTQLLTNVTANMDGVYHLRLTATKNGVESFDTLTFTRDTVAPIIDIGANVVTNATRLLSSSTSDATLLGYQWSQISGPGTIIFGSPIGAATTASATVDGTYLVQLSVTDEAGHTASDTISFTWDAHAPAVDAGSDFSVSVATATNALVSDASSVTYNWTKVSGPGKVTFSSTSLLNPLVSADVDGLYVLSLRATDVAGNSSQDEVEFYWQRFSKRWKLFDPLSYIFDSSKIKLTNGVASLAPIQNIDPIDSSAEFNASGATLSGVAWNTSNLALELNSAGLTAKTGTYISNVIDFGSTKEVSRLYWENPIPGPYQRDLPKNGASDPVEWGPDAIQNMSDLVLLYHFNEDAGSTSFTDSSGNLTTTAQEMTATCNSASGQCPLLNYRGRIGRGAAFDGANDYLTIADDAANRVVGDMTFAAWIKIGSVNFNYFLEKGSADGCDNYAFFTYGGKLSFEFSKNAVSSNCAANSGNNVFIADTGTNLALNTWYHVAVTYDHSTGLVSFYKNGTLSSQIANSERVSATTLPVRIGRQWWDGAAANQGYLNGGLDEMALFKRKLTLSEIQQFYRRGLYRLDMQVRACADATCSTNPPWRGPDGGSLTDFYTYFNEDTQVSDLPVVGMGSTRYFQYKATFNSPDGIVSPLLKLLSVTSFDTLSPTITLFTGPRAFTTLTGFSETVESDHLGDVKYQLSLDGASWYWHNGSSWVIATGFLESNFATSIDTKISDFPIQVGGGSLYFRAFLNKNPGIGYIKLKGVNVFGTYIP